MLSTDQFHLSTGNLPANAGDVSVCSVYLIEPETNETAIYGCPTPANLMDILVPMIQEETPVHPRNTHELVPNEMSSEAFLTLNAFHRIEAFMWITRVVI